MKSTEQQFSQISADLVLETLEERIAPATLLVNSTADSGAGTLRQAVLDANATAAPDKIIFDPAIFTEGTKITLTTGQISITQPLTIVGPRQDRLTIDGNSSDRIFIINDGNAAKDIKVSISGMSFTNGSSNFGGAILSSENLSLVSTSFSGNNATNLGGALYHTDGALKIQSSVFVTNSAASFGALSVLTNDNVFLKDITISQNSATASAGGAYFYINSNGPSAKLTINNVKFINNSANDTGGAIVSLDGTSGKVSGMIQSSTFIDNSSTVAASNAGGLTLQVAGTGVKATLSGVKFSHNETQGHGGGLRILESAPTQKTVISLRNVEATQNEASLIGGGIDVNVTSSDLKIQVSGRTVIANNEASEGGGISFSGGNQLSISGASLIGNNASFEGGGIYLTNSAELNLTRSQLIGNFSGGNGGGITIVNSSEANIKANVIKDNSALAQGGGICVFGSGKVEITESRFSGNKSTSFGGAISFEPAVPNSTITKCQFFDNSAASGGALGILSNSAAINVSNLLFLGNHASSTGGAIYAFGPFPIEVSKSSFTYNTGQFSAGAIFGNVSGGMKLINCTVAANTANVDAGGIRNNSAAPIQLTNVKIFGNSAFTNPDKTGAFV